MAYSQLILEYIVTPIMAMIGILLEPFIYKSSFRGLLFCAKFWTPYVYDFISPIGQIADNYEKYGFGFALTAEGQ